MASESWLPANPMESVNQMLGKEELPPEMTTPVKPQELVKHEALMVELREVLSQHALRKKTTANAWPIAERIVHQLDAIVAHLPEEEMPKHAMLLRERELLEEKFRQLRKEAKKDDMPSSLRAGQIILHGDLEEAKKKGNTIYAHGWRGDDNEMCNVATCGIWNYLKCDSDRDFMPRWHGLTARLNVPEEYSSKRVPAPPPYLP